MAVTAILITWKRQENIPRIVENLLKFDFIDEIIIRDNSKCENLKCYARYFLTEKAKNDLIYVQDDDCINHDIDKLFEEYKDGIICGGTQGYMDALNTPPYSNTSLALVGFGAIFDRKIIDFSEYLSKYPEDNLFYSEADRIFTLNNKTKVISCNIEILNEEKEAMSKEPNHLADRELIIKRHNGINTNTI
jgi:hypothetical protein